MRVLVAVFGFFAGISAASLFTFSWSAVTFIVLLTGIFLVLFLVRRKTTFVFTALFFVFMLLGVLRVEYARESLPSSLASRIGEEIILTGKVVAEPDIRETTVRLTVQVKTEQEHTKVLVVAPLFPEIRYGETITAEGVLRYPEPFDIDEGRVFAYDAFLAKDGIYAIIPRAHVDVVEERSTPGDHVWGAFSDLKFSGMNALSTALPEPHASLSSGLILGGKQGLGKELLDAFILTGLVHIIVLSGYNVMIVADAVLKVFGLFAKRYAALAAGVVITVFVLIAGAGAASVRAGIMAGIALFGRSTGRTYDAFRALVVAAVLMLVWNPLLLMYDPGFQLSFIATLGLIFGTPLTERWVKKVQPSFLREIIAATIAAQISVLPLLVYQNGLFSFVSLPANILVLPLVPVAMLLSALAGLAGALVPALAPFIGLPAYAVLSLIISLTEFFAGLPFAGITIPAFPFVFVVVLYALLALIVLSAHQKAYVARSK